jgi:hypothetical protein
MRCFIFLFIVFASHLHALKIAVVTLAVGEKYQQAVQPGMIGKQEYCNEHRYDFFCVTESLDPERHCAWSKIKLIQKVLPDYDWVFWTDADSLIMNPKVCLEDLIDDNYFFIICKQCDGQINSGQFLIKNNPVSFQFLNDVYAPELKDKGGYEQNAVVEVIDRPAYASNVLILHQRAMNSIIKDGPPESLYRPGDFILHFYATHNLDELSAYMTRWSQYLKANKTSLRSRKSPFLRRRAI